LPLPQPTSRTALVVLQCAAVAIVLAALPYQLFQLDRYTFAKELVLLVAALMATLCALASARLLFPPSPGKPRSAAGIR